MKVKEVFKVIWANIRFILKNYYGILISLTILYATVYALSTFTGVNAFRFLIYVFVVVFLLLLKYTIDVGRRIEESHNTTLPVLKSRITTKMEDGTVYVKKADWQKAVVYLANVEDCLERNGVVYAESGHNTKHENAKVL